VTVTDPTVAKQARQTAVTALVPLPQPDTGVPAVPPDGPADAEARVPAQEPGLKPAGKTALTDLLGADRPPPWYLRKALWLGLLALAAIAGGVWWWLDQRAAAALPAYNTAAATLGNVTLSVTANGTVQPTRTYAIGSELSGTVLRVNVDVNDVVRRGQVLVELDTAKLADQIARTQAGLTSAIGGVAQADASIREARAVLGRLEMVWTLSEGQVPALAELDTARAALARALAAGTIARASVADARAALSTDRINLSKSFIRAPADGVVLTRTVEPGSAVAASFQAVTLFTLAADLTRLRVWAYVDEADVGVVQAGQAATFTVSAFPNRQFPADVTRVGSGATITDNVVTYLTYLDVGNADLVLKPGMTATATIISTSLTGVLLVPNTALRFEPSQAASAGRTGGFMSALSPRRQTGNGPGAVTQSTSTAGAKAVWVLRDGQPVRLPVTAGISDGRMTQIVSGGLRAGMLVITEQRAGSAP
jgi:HlyD family secretion protein